MSDIAQARDHALKMLDDVENGRYNQGDLIRAIEEQIRLCGGTVPPYPLIRAIEEQIRQSGGTVPPYPSEYLTTIHEDGMAHTHIVAAGSATQALVRYLPDDRQIDAEPETHTTYESARSGDSTAVRYDRDNIRHKRCACGMAPSAWNLREKGRQ